MTPRFLSPFIAQLVGRVQGRDLWRLQQPLRYQSAYPLPRPLEVPADFVTDLASVPRVPIVSARRRGRGTAAAILHDYLYIVMPRLCSRRVADAVLREALRCEQPELGVQAVPLVYRMVLWAGVRAWGYWGYHGRDPISTASLQPSGGWQAVARQEGIETP